MNYEDDHVEFDCRRCFELRELCCWKLGTFGNINQGKCYSICCELRYNCVVGASMAAVFCSQICLCPSWAVYGAVWETAQRHRHARAV